jgi:hypothetical protein
MLSPKCEIQYFMEHKVITRSNGKSQLKFIMLDPSVIQLSIVEKKRLTPQNKNRP